MSGTPPQPRPENENRRIYDENYDPGTLDLRPEFPYDRRMIEIRNAAVRCHAYGRAGLDLGCGTGSYLLPHASSLRSGVGVDFSSRMLTAMVERMSTGTRVEAVQADVTQLPFRSGTFDAIWSFSTLYYVEDIPAVLRELERTLRPGGVAIIELGNRHSLNAVVAHEMYLEAGWARQHLLSYAGLRRLVDSSGFEMLSWRSFQLLPMYGSPRRLRFLHPLFTASWKRLMGVVIRGRMLDEWLSSTWLGRRIAFRHILTLRRR